MKSHIDIEHMVNNFINDLTVDMINSSEKRAGADGSAALQSNACVINLEELWADLESGVHQIYSRKQMSCQRYMSLYSQVYKYCTAQCPSSQPISLRSRKQNKGGASEPASCSSSAELIGFELYKRMQKYLEEHVVSIRKNTENMLDEDLLHYMSDEWRKFQFSSKILNGLCSYLNRHWIRRIIDEGSDTVFEIYHLALDIWDTHVMSAVHPQLTRAVLRLIAADRRGEGVDRRLISDIVSCYIAVESSALTARQRATGHLVDPHLFKSMFEKEFIKETEAFYAMEAEEFLRNNPITEYMKRIEMRLNEEQIRCSAYLCKSTLTMLSNVLVNIFIADRMDLLKTEFKSLLVVDRSEDLKRMYELCSMVYNGLVDLKTSLEEHILAEGMAAIDRAGPAACTDPKLYITTLLNVYNKYSNLVSVAFRGDRTFIAALDSACSKYMNNNPATVASQSGSKSPELLARYCDMLLRKSAKNSEEVELETLLNEVMIIFKYMDDKDVFQTFYCKLLAKRLVGQLSASEDAESSMISKLKQSCGFDYTVKLQRMFTDVGLSKSLNEEYRASMKKGAQTGGIDFSVLVLSTGAWPLNSVCQVNVLPPFAKCMRSFTNYYTNHFNGRKISWLHNYAKVEVLATCFDRYYCIVMTMFQATVLCMFNHSWSYTVEKLQEITMLSPEVLNQVLLQLIKFKLFMAKSPEGRQIDVRDPGESADSNGELMPNSRIELAQFRSKKYKLDFSKIPLKLEINKEQETVEKSVAEDRRILVQACVVRIMKMRKRLPHQQLVTEVITQLTPLFTPRVSLIKKCIDDLIDKDYLQRVENDRDMYQYLA